MLPKFDEILSNSKSPPQRPIWESTELRDVNEVVGLLPGECGETRWLIDAKISRGSEAIAVIIATWSIDESCVAQKGSRPQEMLRTP